MEGKFSDHSSSLQNFVEYKGTHLNKVGRGMQRLGGRRWVRGKHGWTEMGKERIRRTIFFCNFLYVKFLLFTYLAIEAKDFTVTIGFNLYEEAMDTFSPHQCVISTSFGLIKHHRFYTREHN